MKFAVTVVSPPRYPHSAAFSEVAETIHCGLISLGHDSVLTTEGALSGRRHIVLGSNLLPAYPLPLERDAILYNLEQVDVHSGWLGPELVDIFRNHRLWDYNQRNANALAALVGRSVAVVPIGYAPELTRILPAAVPDIDVLFVGSMNPRRQRVIDGMRSAGLRVSSVFGVYGRERDALIGRAKLLINIHFYEAKVLEVVRLTYLLANRCAVLSEHSSDPSDDAEFAGGVAFADYEDLVHRACRLVDDGAERQRLSSLGFKIVRARPAAEFIRRALERAQ